MFSPRQTPLIARVTIALLLAATIPLAFAVWSLFDVNRAGMHQQVLRTHAVAAATAADRVSAAVEANRRLARAVASNESITEDPHSESAQRFLQNLLVADPSVVMVDLVDERGATVVRAQLRGIAAASNLASDAPRERIWGAGGKLWLLVSEPLPDGRGNARVMTVADPANEALDPVEIGEHATMILASASGELIAGPQSVSSFPAEMFATARTARVNGTGVYRTPQGDVLGAFAPVTGTSWVVLSRQPSSIAERIAGVMRRKAGLAVAVAAILALLIAALAQRTIVAPIRAVIAEQQRLAGGVPQTPRGNELDQLRAGTELLRRRILDQEELDRVFLGRYQVLGLVGQGGMGAVFRGWDPRLRREVALKTIRFEPEGTGTERTENESLLAEAVSTASVSHPNIVGIYDVEDAADATFMAMEFIDGVTLQSLVRHRNGITAEETAVIGLAMARALDAAHSRGLLHRDIKPANVLLGRDGAIKVTDFGIAALMSDVKSVSVVFGTPGYIAPETAAGKACDARSDLFALGTVLYDCVAGRNPFIRASSRETLVATILSVPPPLARKRTGGPVLHALSELVTALMQKRPEDRPQTAAEVSRRLEVIVTTHGLRWDAKIEGAPPEPGHSPAVLVQTVTLEAVKR